MYNRRSNFPLIKFKNFIYATGGCCFGIDYPQFKILKECEYYDLNN